MGTIIVSSLAPGTNCWSAARFVGGKRCRRVRLCDCPERKDCKAVDAEVAHLRAVAAKEAETLERRIAKVTRGPKASHAEHR